MFHGTVWIFGVERGKKNERSNFFFVFVVIVGQTDDKKSAGGRKAWLTVPIKTFIHLLPTQFNPSPILSYPYTYLSYPIHTMSAPWALDAFYPTHLYTNKQNALSCEPMSNFFFLPCVPFLLPTFPHLLPFPTLSLLFYSSPTLPSPPIASTYRGGHASERASGPD